MENMKKVFLYLYPIEEYTKMFLFNNDKFYDELNVKHPLTVLNECIQKRYRNNGYQVVFALYPDKDIFGIIPKKEDKIIYTDVLFTEASAIDENGNKKKNFVPKYPNEHFLIEQLGKVEKLVLGGYHAQDCVKRVGEVALKNGIDTIIDLDMTDFFFTLYKNEGYFNIEKYDPKRYKEYIFNKFMRYGDTFAQKQFNRIYSSPAYGFNENNREKVSKTIEDDIEI